MNDTNAASNFDAIATSALLPVTAGTGIQAHMQQLLVMARDKQVPAERVADGILKAHGMAESFSDMWCVLDAADSLPARMVPPAVLFGFSVRLLRSPALFERLRAFRTLQRLMQEDETYRLHAGRVLDEYLSQESVEFRRRFGDAQVSAQVTPASGVVRDI